MFLKGIAFVLFFFIGLLGSVYGQLNPNNYKYTSFGLALQGTYFYGDVSGGIRTVRPGLELSAMRKVSPRVTLGLAGSWFELMGSDYLNNSLTNPVQHDKYIRNLHFKSTVFSLQGFMQYDILPSYRDYVKRPIYNVFLKAGLGAFYFEPRTKDSTGSWVDLRPLKTEGKSYANYSVMLPISIGVRYKIGYHLDFEAELSYVYTFTDYLDDVSGDYPAVDPNSNSNYYTYRSLGAKDPQTGRDRDLNYIENELGYMPVTNGNTSYYSGYGPGNSRGSRAGFDAYIMVSFRLIYVLPQNRVSCPRF
jgi:hypothetical protein